MIMVGVALINKVKAPPPNSDARKIDRSRLSLANLRVALEIYKGDCGNYPAAGDGLAALVHPPLPGSGWKGPYIYDLKNDLWGSPFQYAPAETNLLLFGCGPDRQAGTADDITVQRADIALNQSLGSVYAVVVFGDGTRKVVREQVKQDPGVRVNLLTDKGG
ncbi:MAG: type II secretion system protein GspG [Kiritimatiellia bacterium]